VNIVIRPLRTTDRPAAARLLDDLVGPGFWDFTEADAELSFVAATDGRVVGAVLARLAAAEDPDWRTALGPTAGLFTAGDPVLHVRELAVAPRARRGGLASRLLTRVETEAYAVGARTAFAFGWLPAGRPEPDSVPFYESAGYAPGADIAGFFAQGSIESGARCPYCGEPPCRCAVRPFVKRLAGAAV
jgi:GNAT superfamily N-acetyltransferase